MSELSKLTIDANGSTVLSSGLAGFWVVVLNSCSATMCGLRISHTGHGCTVGVNRDPPVWLSIQAG